MNVDPHHVTDTVREVYRTTFASLHGIHQREGVQWMCQRERSPGAVPSVAGGILADEMGLGKTYEVAALMRLRPMRTLIVTTLSTIMQWQDVLSSHLGSLALVLRSRDQAEGAGFRGAQTVLTTYSMFQHCDKVPKALGEGWGRIVLDEAHIIRNSKGNTHRSLARLAAVHRWVLTGTPINNTVRDLHTLVAWLGAPGLGLDMIRTHLLLRRTKDGEAVRSPEFSVPSLTINDSLVTLSAGERTAYDMIEKSGKAHAAEGHGTSEVLHEGPCFSVRVMESVLRCRQACTHLCIMGEAVCVAVGTSEASRTLLQQAMCDPGVQRMACSPAALASSAKLTRLVELIISHNRTEKSLVFCDWIREMEIIQDTLTEIAGVSVVCYSGGMDLGQRQSALRSFQGMEMGAVMLVQMQCGGTGLNVQCASRVYIMRPAWNPCTEQQAIARSHRIGQTRPVIVTRLIAADSIDVRCTEVQGRKLAMIDWVIGSGASVQHPVQQVAERSDCLLLRKEDG